jgi:subtilisin family serine protease
MKAAIRTLLAGLAFWLFGAAAAQAQTPAVAPDPALRVLVMLQLPPAHFRGNGDYGGSYGDAIGHSARRRVAARIAREEGLTLADDWPMPMLGVDCFVMELPPGQEPQAVAERISRRKSVAWAEPMNLYHTQGGGVSHADPLFQAQPAARLWRLNALHEIATGRNVRVAVIDSGVDASNPDLAGQVAVRKNFVAGPDAAAERHGTAVAGVIAARADNGQGGVGVAPEARLLALRACWQRAVGDSVCDSLSLARALVFAIESDAQVINLSLGGPPAPVLARLIDIALTRGAVVVAAYDQALPGGGFPASHAGVVAVAGAPVAGGRGVVVAPGRDIPTSLPGAAWGLVSGDSYAAAHVSGLFALLRQEQGVRRGLASLVLQPGGGGLIDACATVLHTAGPCDCGCAHFAERAARAQP